MDYSVENNKNRDFFKKDFSELKSLIHLIRTSLITGKPINLNSFNLSNIIYYIPNETFIYITLFQEGQNSIRWGSSKKTIEETINRIVEKLRQNKNFNNFAIESMEKCRILFEYVYETNPVDISKIQMNSFAENRFEPGITGIKITLDNNTTIYMPTDAWANSQMDIKSALNSLLRKTPIKNMTNSISERINILKRTPHKAYIIKSRAFITYNEELLPLYRGNILYEYSPEEIKKNRHLMAQTGYLIINKIMVSTYIITMQKRIIISTTNIHQDQ